MSFRQFLSVWFDRLMALPFLWIGVFLAVMASGLLFYLFYLRVKKLPIRNELFKSFINAVETDRKPETITPEVLLLVGASVSAALFVLFLIMGLYNSFCHTTPPLCDLAKRSAAALVTMLTTLVAAPTLLFWWLRRDKHKERELKQKDRDLEAKGKGQNLEKEKFEDQKVQRQREEDRYVDERFSNATLQMASKDPMIVLGQIAVLEGLAHHSEESHWKIITYLANFIREKAKLGSRQAGDPLPVEVQAALTVIGRRKKEYREWERENGYGINLSHCDLSGADLSGHGPDGPDGHFEWVDFTKSNFQRSNLKNCVMDDAVLTHANFIGANLNSARFNGARMPYTVFSGLEHVEFGNEEHLSRTEGVNACFKNAILYQSIFGYGDWSGANFEGAHLQMSILGLQGGHEMNFHRPGYFNGAKLQSTYLGGLHCIDIQANRIIFNGATVGQWTMFPENCFPGRQQNKLELANRKYHMIVAGNDEDFSEINMQIESNWHPDYKHLFDRHFPF